MPGTKNHATLLKALREFGLGYPGAHTKSPWPGHLDLAVKDKTFAFLSSDDQPFSMSCKLPHSGLAALSLPFTAPTGYGLGKSGWVTASMPDGAAPPIALFKAWIDESYRAQAPKKLIAELDRAAGATPPPKQSEKRAGVPTRRKAGTGAAKRRKAGAR